MAPLLWDCGSLLPLSEAVNFWVAEVVRLQNSPQKLNSHEFSYQFFHSLSASYSLTQSADTGSYVVNAKEQEAELPQARPQAELGNECRDRQPPTESVVGVARGLSFGVGHREFATRCVIGKRRRGRDAVGRRNSSAPRVVDRSGDVRLRIKVLHDLPRCIDDHAMMQAIVTGRSGEFAP